jgi:hypothetical protein
MVWGKDSTSGTIDEPVVVNPEADSKNASMKQGTDPLRINGKVPRQIRTNQDEDTAKKPSLLLIFSDEVFLDIVNKITESRTDIKDDQRKGSGDSL